MKRMNRLKYGIFAMAAVLLMSFCAAGCGDVVEEPVSEQTSEVIPPESSVPEPEPEAIKPVFEVDFTKISPMILEQADPELIEAAHAVIRAFLNYETSVSVETVGNPDRFMVDLGYVVMCTCPLFSAFTDYNEVTAYDSETKEVSWNFYVSEEELQGHLDRFSEVMAEYMSVIDEDDSEAMRAILLYYDFIQGYSYDHGLLGDAYETMDPAEYHLRNSPYQVIVNKSGICTNTSEALMFLYTQAGLTAGTVSHMGGAGAHMWNVMQIDGKYYYCDATWDAEDAFWTFGMTAEEREAYAGDYSAEEGSMLWLEIPEVYDITDTRFQILREKVPVEITAIRADKDAQTITFEGHEYEYTFPCVEQ